MKTIKNILFSVILFSTITLCWGLEVADNFSHLKSSIENPIKANDSQCLVSSESEFEEDVPVIASIINVQVINSKGESISVATIFSPLNFLYSIWQPPKIS